MLSGGAAARIAASKLKELVITDSIMPTEAVRARENIRVISIAPLIGEAIARTATEESVSSLFDWSPHALSFHDPALRELLEHNKGAGPR